MSSGGGGMFGNFTLADRLKAAVNTLEATGTSLQNQARAMSQQQQQAGQQGQPSSTSTGQVSSHGPSPSRSSSPSVHTGAKGSDGSVSAPTITGNNRDGGEQPDSNQPRASGSNSIPSPSKAGTVPVPGSSSAETATSPTRVAGHYITQAGDAFTGFRKSLHFPRASFDGTNASGSRPNSSSGTGSGSGRGGAGVARSSLPHIGTVQPQELKDLPHSEGGQAVATKDLASTLLTPNQFSLGSDPSSLSGTPRPHSPAPHYPSSSLGHGSSSGLPVPAMIPLPRSPLDPSVSNLPPPDPSDPATYPLPLSPPTSTSDPLSLSVPDSSTFVDPLGASPKTMSLSETETSQGGAGGKSHEEDTEANTAEADLELRKAEELVSDDKDSGLGLGIDGVKLDSKEDDVPRETQQEDTASTVATDTKAVPSTESPQGDLAAAERRYQASDLSQRFTTLLTQKHNADKVLKELTPLEGGIADHEALEGWVRMMNGKVEMITEEMTRLQSQIALQGARMEEIRDTHRLEGTSQGELITRLRAQLSTAESNLASKATELLSLSTVRADLAKAQTQAKEEEEKRTKAISLLKTVRMKLVKVEKEKEEVERDRAEERAERSTAKDELERYRADREREVSALRRGFEKELREAKERYEKDLAAKKGVWELEMITTKASHAKELSGKSTKVTGLEAIVKELNSTKQQQFEEIQTRQAEVESSRSELETLRYRTKDLEFQLREVNERCALLENAAAGPSSSPEIGQSRTQSRGRHLLGVGVGVGGSGSGAHSPAGGRSATPSPNRGASSVEVQRLLAEAESRSESRISDLRSKIRTLESERNTSEEEWAVKLAERVRELERLKRSIQEKEGEYAESLRTTKDRERVIEEGVEARKGLEKQIRALQAQVEEAREEVEGALDTERLAKEELSSLKSQMSDLRAQLDDSKSYGSNLKQANKTLRDELRKVQSSVQLMERQRNPGVGYWSAASASASAGPSSSSSSTNLNLRNGLASPTPRSGMTTPGEMEIAAGPGSGSGAGGASDVSTPTKARGSLDANSMRSESTRGIGNGNGVGRTTTGGGMSPAASEALNSNRDKEEEEVNLEYLRNVILQFLEHKEMRPNLVRVLSVILRFTPQELRRLNSKLLS